MKKSTKIITALLAAGTGALGAYATIKTFKGKKGEKVIDGSTMPKPDNSEYNANLEAAKDFVKEQSTEEEE